MKYCIVLAWRKAGGRNKEKKGGRETDFMNTGYVADGDLDSFGH